MKETDVTYFGTLLDIKPEAVKTAVEDGSLGEKVKALNLMGSGDVETLKTNYAKEVRSTYFDELTDQAKKGEMPQDLYKPIHGAVSEKLEKALSKKYDITEYENVDDLVGKAISKNKGQSNDKQLQELKDLNADLKEANTKLVTEKDDAVRDAEDKFQGQIMTRDMDKYYDDIPFDLTDVEEDKLKETKAIRKRTLKSVFETTYSTELVEGKIIVKDKQGDVIKTKATLEPVPVSDVLVGLAKDLGQKLTSPESGGQGGSSSGQKGARFKDLEEFEKYCVEKGIVSTSAEGLKILADSGLKLF